ncbi:hypothetical protein RJ639_039184 [Escallonia herrerae]|uniref:Phosphotransferase n=1 Tax=Escallonia herrerae TaxID=1293975 RepID=A0AA88WNE2_9ASTE|nr:hypothetical protein RJ639_039184 [Escallonia herrerae]
MRKEVVVAVTTAAAVVAVAMLLRQTKRRSERRWRHAQRILRKFARDCATPVPKLWNVANDVVAEMQAGLGSSESNLSMLASYVASLPTGDEKGLYYGVNLRGDSFLILRARLGGKNEPIYELHREEISFPSSVMAGTSKEIFDYIALHLASFVTSHTESTSNDRRATQRKLGFTVSYPVDEFSSSSGTAIKWKTSSADDTVELAYSLCTTFHAFIDRIDIKIRLEKGWWMTSIRLWRNMAWTCVFLPCGLSYYGVIVQVDDTIGDLAGGRYYSTDSVAAVSLGMGTNAAYVEPAQSVTKWQGQSPKSGEIVIINVQWGSFRSSHLPVTEFDSSLDAESSNPCSRIFEKLVSGMYLGEIVRRVLLKMSQEAALFGDTVPPKLTTPYTLSSPDMAAMHQDTSEDHGVVDEKLTEVFEITNSTPAVREVVAEVCDIVAERGARLAGAGIVGIIKKLDRSANKKSVVTVEGGLYEHYRLFRNYVHSSVWEMLGNELSDNLIIQHSHGGSGTGALFLAASQTENAAS